MHYSGAKQESEGERERPRSSWLIRSGKKERKGEADLRPFRCIDGVTTFALRGRWMWPFEINFRDSRACGFSDVRTCFDMYR